MMLVGEIAATDDLPAIYKSLVTACTVRGLTSAQVFETLDAGTHLPASLGRIPHHIFERCEMEKSSDRHVANQARRTRRMRTARQLVTIYCEQTRVRDIATGARGLAWLIASCARIDER